MTEKYLETDVCVIGLGPIGLTSMIVVAQDGLKCIGVESNDFVGGQCAALYPNKILKNLLYYESSALNMIQILVKQARSFENNQILLNAKVLSIRHDGKHHIQLADSRQILARAVILAIGNGPIKLLQLSVSAENIKYDQPEIAGNNSGKQTILVLGGGDAALDAAILLAEQGNDVHLIHRRNKFRASQHTIDRVINNPHIMKHTIEHIEERLYIESNKVISVHLDSGEVLVDYVYVFYGMNYDAEDHIIGIKLEDNRVRHNNGIVGNNVYVVGDSGFKGSDLNELMGITYRISRLIKEYYCN